MEDMRDQSTTDWVLNPKFVANERMAELNKLMEPLEEQLDVARQRASSMDHTAAANGNPPATINKIRELREALGRLGKEYWEISLEINKDYHAMKPLNRRGPPRMYAPTEREMKNANNKKPQL